jgi:hypothetical protein
MPITWWADGMIPTARLPTFGIFRWHLRSYHRHFEFGLNHLLKFLQQMEFWKVVVLLATLIFSDPNIRVKDLTWWSYWKWSRDGSDWHRRYFHNLYQGHHVASSNNEVNRVARLIHSDVVRHLFEECFEWDTMYQTSSNCDLGRFHYKIRSSTNFWWPYHLRCGSDSEWSVWWASEESYLFLWVLLLNQTKR